jgi:cytochrome bd-type quinol oxidase subunit 2
MKKIITRAQAALATVVVFGHTAAFAALTQPQLPSGRAVTGQSIRQLLEQFAQFLMLAAVTLAVIAIVYGGIVWMYKGSEEGKKWLFRGAIGVGIVLGVGVILATVARLVTTQSIG